MCSAWAMLALAYVALKRTPILGWTFERWLDFSTAVALGLWFA